MVIYFTFDGKKCKHVPITGDRWSIVIKKKKKKKVRSLWQPSPFFSQASNFKPQTSDSLAS